MAIEVGDVVQIVWGCCEAARREQIGKTFTVGAIVPNDEDFGCNVCGYETPANWAFWKRGKNIRELWFPIPWLIKVDPPAEPVSTKVADEEHA